MSQSRGLGKGRHIDTNIAPDPETLMYFVTYWPKYKKVRLCSMSELHCRTTNVI